MIEFPSIGQYRQVIKAMHERSARNGVDEQGNPIYKSVVDPLPVLKYVGTVKLHGTNSSVVQTPDGEIYYQSRNRIIDPENDNAGFARFCQELDAQYPGTFWADTFDVIREEYGLDNTVVIYGEWCCGNVQKNVALAEIPEKQFIIFAIADVIESTDPDEESYTRWLSPNELSGFNISKRCSRVHCIYEYPTFEMTIDFNNPALTQNQLVDLTLQVEKECPVGKQFGVSGTGEGIVWQPFISTFANPKFWFKVKGKDHSVSNVKTLAEVDLEKLKSISDFIDCIVTENRLNQGIAYLQEMNKPLDRTSTGEFLSWIVNDVNKEEFDRIAASELNDKEVNRQVGIKARKWFFTKVG